MLSLLQNNGMRRKHQELEWLRGYRCHTLWEGSERIGRIEVTRSESGLLYRCAAGTLLIEERRLLKAKRWVSRQAVASKNQLSLF